MKKIVLWLNSFLLCFIIALVVFNYYAFNQDFYKKEFEKNNVYAIHPNADQLSADLMLYFSESDYNLAFRAQYSEREILHLQDVKNIFQSEIWILFLAMGLFVCLLFVQFFIKQRIIWTVFLGSMISIVVSGLLAIASFFFNSSFIFFHKIFFSNDYWMLPPESMLITLFPKDFFADFFVSFILTRASVAVILLALSSVFIYRRQIKNYINRVSKRKRK